MKMKSKTHYGKIEHGVFSPHLPGEYNKALNKLEGKSVEVKVAVVSKRRSNPQNAYYRGYLVPEIAKETEHTEDDIHRAMKHKFLTMITDNKKHAIKFSKSTTELSTVEFEKYLASIRVWANVFLGMFLRLPNEIDLY